MQYRLFSVSEQNEGIKSEFEEMSCVSDWKTGGEATGILYSMGGGGGGGLDGKRSR